tara:strand:- start:1401 stop:2078 length:678 start_codon:yes stop_codon:yes gene_type:complete
MVAISIAGRFTGCGMTDFVLATRNRHKVEELHSMVGDEFRLKTLADFPGLPEVPEHAESFAGNATLKALTMAQLIGAEAGHSNRFVIADDSGLEVDALGGAPGVHSARYASSGSANAIDEDNNAKLLKELENVPPENRGARFVCVIAAAEIVGRDKTPEVHLSEGRCEGAIAVASSGAEGFGYDPLFIPSGHKQTFAEMGLVEKNAISHRAAALKGLVEWLRQAT